MRTRGGRTVLLTRAVDQATSTAARLGERGYGVVIAPLMRIERLNADVPTDVQAILVTSRNGADALAAAAKARSIPVLAVGDATARSLRDAGFSEVYSASGDASALAALAMKTLDPTLGPVVHARGAEIRTSPLGPMLEAGFSVDEMILYRTQSLSNLPQEARNCDTALIYSPGSARRLCAAYPPDWPSLAVIAISTAALDPLCSAPFANPKQAASHPSEDAMFDLLDKLPKNPVAEIVSLR